MQLLSRSTDMASRIKSCIYCKEVIRERKSDLQKMDELFLD